MKKYNIIYADPPWQSEPGWWNNNAWKASRFEEHYDTMSVEEICALPVKDFTTDNAHLYLWTTSREPRGDNFGKREDSFDHGQAGSDYQQVVERKTIGWQPTCGHSRLPRIGGQQRRPGERKPGTVLDPFAGAHTTGVVCIEENRDYIGIELSADYNEIGRRRLETATRSKQHTLEM